LSAHEEIAAAAAAAATAAPAALATAALTTEEEEDDDEAVTDEEEDEVTDDWDEDDDGESAELNVGVFGDPTNKQQSERPGQSVQNTARVKRSKQKVNTNLKKSTKAGQ